MLPLPASRLDPAPTAITPLTAMSSHGNADRQVARLLGGPATTTGTTTVPQVAHPVDLRLGREIVVTGDRISATAEIRTMAEDGATTTEVRRLLLRLLALPHGTRLPELLRRALGAMVVIRAPRLTFPAMVLLPACLPLLQAALPLPVPLLQDSRP